jgi:hypothetical protein
VSADEESYLARWRIQQETAGRMARAERLSRCGGDMGRDGTPPDPRWSRPWPNLTERRRPRDEEPRLRLMWRTIGDRYETDDGDMRLVVERHGGPYGKWVVWSIYRAGALLAWRTLVTWDDVDAMSAAEFVATQRQDGEEKRRRADRLRHLLDTGYLSKLSVEEHAFMLEHETRWREPTLGRAVATIDLLRRIGSRRA